MDRCYQDSRQRCKHIISYSEFNCIRKQNRNTKETTTMLYYSIDKSRRRTLALLTKKVKGAF